MPINFSFNEAQGYFISHWSGDITDALLIKAYKSLLADKQFKIGFHEIVDLTNANLEGVTSAGLRDLLSMIGKHITDTSDVFKTAIIAPNDLAFGLSRIYEALTYESKENVGVFRVAEDALQWLGIDQNIVNKL